ncbi:MAG TPA: dihydropteroate synthase [Sphingobacteriaceae bacterium]|nr:dihydropteroate synthase [Sphingobacteriaceae bacterium]
MIIGNREFLLGRRTYIAGIINLTPDSFSDGGLVTGPEEAARLARELAAQGADIIDIGAESTRPGSFPISADTELERLLPALRAVRAAVDVPISVDTYKSDVAAVAVRQGADMVNDISGLRADPLMAVTVASLGVPVVIMHRRPFSSPFPGDVWPGLLKELAISLEKAAVAGIPREKIILDPGFGFGKTDRQNLDLVMGLGKLKALGYPVLLGPSRKSTLGRLLQEPPLNRLEGTLALSVLAVAQGVDFLRVHDVASVRKAVRVADVAVRGLPEDPQ